MDCFFSKGSTILKKQNLYDTITVNRPFLQITINLKRLTSLCLKKKDLKEKNLIVMLVP